MVEGLREAIISGEQSGSAQTINREEFKAEMRREIAQRGSQLIQESTKITTSNEAQSKITAASKQCGYCLLQRIISSVA
jgi:hypothetical protein